MYIVAMLYSGEISCQAHSDITEGVVINENIRHADNIVILASNVRSTGDAP